MQTNVGETALSLCIIITRCMLFVRVVLHFVKYVSVTNFKQKKIKMLNILQHIKQFYSQIVNLLLFNKIMALGL